jgi:SPP1 family predicted phage head-tail adaptor
MRAGELRQRLILQQNQPNTGSYGERLPDWVSLSTIWGAVNPVSARQFIEQQRDQAEITHKVKIRFRSDIKSGMRLLFGTRILHIEGVLNTDEANRELLLMCREVINGG